MTGDAELARKRRKNAVDMPWTLWSAAYAYAQVMRDICTPRFGATAHEPGYWDTPTMLLAYAIADYGSEAHATVTSPTDLADLSMSALHQRLHPVLLANSLSSLSLSARPAPREMPAEGEPAYEAFMMMKAEIDDFNAGGPAAVLADPYRRAKAHRDSPAWYQRESDAQKLVGHTVLALVDSVDLEGDVTLALVANRLPGAEDTSLAALLRAAHPDARKARRWRWPGSTPPAAGGSSKADGQFASAQRRVATLAVPAGRFDVSAKARDLLALLLYTAAHERDQAIADVPWSAVRARTLLDHPALLGYLENALAAFGHDARRDVDHDAFQRMLEQDRKGKRTALRDPIAHTLRGVRSAELLETVVMPDAMSLLDAVLVAERGAFPLGSTITTHSSLSDVSTSAIVTGAVWKLGQPPTGKPGMIDLTPGTPAGYIVRSRNYGETRVSAKKCSAADAEPSAGE
jgi:hypothetical protein